MDLEALLAREPAPRFSRREFDRMVEAGVFEDERVELLYGRLVEMSPQGTLHADVVARLHARLVLALGSRAMVRGHSPFAASDSSEPEPDLAIVPARRYRDDHPARAFLVVEVADSSARKDRLIKARLYAEAGIGEYWLVDLDKRLLEVYRDPKHGAYRELRRHRRSETVSLLAFPDVAVPLSDLLPAARRRKTGRRR